MRILSHPFPCPCCGLGYRAITVSAVIACFKPFEDEVIISTLIFLPVPGCPLVVKVFEAEEGGTDFTA